MIAWQLQRSLMIAAASILGVGTYTSIRANDEPIAGRHSPNTYRAACARCHGQDGRGALQGDIGFLTPLPDFTDCSFVSREPDVDWVTIVGQGGPVRGFDRRMPSFVEALSPEQIQEALDQVRRFCTENSWPRGELNHPRPMLTEKAFVEDETVLSTSAGTKKQTEVKSKLIFEKRFLSQSQFEVIVPFDILEGEDDKVRMGLGDVAIGAKTVLVASRGAGSILSLAAEVKLPTGNKDRGFGKGVVVFEPFLSYGQGLPFDGFLHLQLGAEIPADQGQAANEMYWRSAIGMSFRQSGLSRTWSPMIEVQGVHEFEDEGKTLWDIAPGIQITINQRQHIRLGLGVQIPINETAGRSVTILAYLLWDWFEGGLLDGW